MKKMTERLGEEVRKAFADAGYGEEYGGVAASNRPDLCQYQCNGAMAAAKRHKKAPIQIAGEVVERLCGNAAFDEVEAVNPGFINITVNRDLLAEYVNEMASDPRMGCGKEEEPKTILVDYGGPNIAKPLHVGHLRSTIIGESVKRIKKFMGNEVVGDVHLGDWGMPIGLVITELGRRHPEWVYFQEDGDVDVQAPTEAPFTIDDLEEVYPYASKKSKEDSAYYEEAAETVARLNKGHKGYRALWRQMVDVSVAEVKKTMTRLHADFDLWKGESDATPYIDGMVDDMRKKGYAYLSDGALVVDVKEEGDKKEVPPCIILKSNGAPLYATTDLATIIDREKNYHPNQIIYLTDKRQDFNFMQMFRCAKKAKLVGEDVELTFIGFGTVNGKDGKPFKTRDGGGMKLEALLSETVEAVYRKIMGNREESDAPDGAEGVDEARGMTEAEVRDVAEKVGIAAIKYGDLSNQAIKDYIFDMERFVSFEGNTGPYIIYTIVRIRSIRRKYEERGGVLGAGATVVAAASDKELAIFLQLTKFQESMEQAYRENAPHKLCQFMYELANAYNSFYHESKILAQEDEGRKASWLLLSDLVQRVLGACVDLLGMEVPERM